MDNADLIDDYVSLLNTEEKSDVKNLQLILDNGSMLNKSLQLGPALDVLNNNSDKFKLLKTKYGETLKKVSADAARKSLSKSISDKNEALLQKVLRAYQPASLKNFIENKETILLDYYYGTGQYKNYVTGTKKYVEGFLMKLPMDSLEKKDADNYNYFKSINATQLETYRHTQTIQFTDIINEYIKNLLSLPSVQVADIKIIQKWSDKILAITATDTAYYKNAILSYSKENAKLLYRAGDKNMAVSKLQKAAKYAPAGYFDSMIADIKDNKLL